MWWMGGLSYLSSVLEGVHGGVRHALAAGRLGGLHQVSEGGGHILYCVDQHHLKSTGYLCFSCN